MEISAYTRGSRDSLGVQNKIRSTLGGDPPFVSMVLPADHPERARTIKDLGSVHLHAFMFPLRSIFFFFFIFSHTESFRGMNSANTSRGKIRTSLSGD